MLNLKRGVNGYGEERLALLAACPALLCSSVQGAEEEWDGHQERKAEAGDENVQEGNLPGVLLSLGHLNHRTAEKDDQGCGEHAVPLEGTKQGESHTSPNGRAGEYRIKL